MLRIRGGTHVLEADQSDEGRAQGFRKQQTGSLSVRTRTPEKEGLASEQTVRTKGIKSERRALQGNAGLSEGA